MATASVAFKSREEYRKMQELDEARKAGLAPAQLDEDGSEINPHIPQYLSSAPWYLNSSDPANNTPSLKHQRKRKSNADDDSYCTREWYQRGMKTYQADKYRKGACENCGAMTHGAKLCMERPRKLGAKWTSKHIASDEKIETLKQLSYDGKRDRWNGYDMQKYARVVGRYEAMEQSRKKYLKEKQLKENNQLIEACEVSHGDNEDEALKVEEEEEEEEEAKLDESKQMDFARVQKRVRTTDGGSTGTIRNLRIREDTAKYLLNLKTDSAFYDPKSRSMREDPLPESDPNEIFYRGDNQLRASGQALEFKQLYIHAWEAFNRGQEIHPEGTPSHAELLFKNHKAIKDTLRSKMKDAILQKYGNAASEEAPPKELLLGQ